MVEWAHEIICFYLFIYFILFIYSGTFMAQKVLLRGVVHKDLCSNC